MTGADDRADADAHDTGDTERSQSLVDAAVRRIHRDPEVPFVMTPPAASEQNREDDRSLGVFLTATKAGVARINPTTSEATQAEVEAAVRRRERELRRETEDGASQNTRVRGISHRPTAGAGGRSTPRATATLAVVLLSCLVVVALVLAGPLSMASAQQDVTYLIGDHGGDAITHALTEFTAGALGAPNSSVPETASQSTDAPTATAPSDSQSADSSHRSREAQTGAPATRSPSNSEATPMAPGETALPDGTTAMLPDDDPESSDTSPPAVGERSTTAMKPTGASDPSNRTAAAVNTGTTNDTAEQAGGDAPPDSPSDSPHGPADRATNDGPSSGNRTDVRREADPRMATDVTTGEPSSQPAQATGSAA